MGEMLTLTAGDGHALQAYAASPDGQEFRAAARGIVLVQEIFGVNHHIRNVCDRYAAQGYAVLAPALFDRIRPGIELGYTQDDVKTGIGLKGQVPDDKALLDVAAAADAMGGMALGIVGFCWGGTVAWLSATRLDKFRAASCWYGGGIAAARGETARCPVQMHFGDQDHSIPPHDIEAIRAAQPTAEVHVYPNAQHGFGCDERGSFNAADAAQATERTLAFFGWHLGG